VVLAAHDLEAATAALETALPVRDPFRDPGVGHFGLANAVYALGDTFIEIVSPTQPDTAAGRYLDRRGGDCGYMVMFELDDEQAVRERLDRLGVRKVLDTAHDDIVDLHLHPKDVTAAIVALDITKPIGSWRWGGPAWTGAIPDHGDGGLSGLTVAAVDPATTATRWGAVLDVTSDEHGALSLRNGQRLEFEQVAEPSAEGIVGVMVDAPIDAPVVVCDVRFIPVQTTATLETR
jgi:hypothetical protein